MCRSGRWLGDGLTWDLRLYFQACIDFGTDRPQPFIIVTWHLPMRPQKLTRIRRTPGAFNALWLTVLVLSLGLFGAGANSQEPNQAPATGFSGALDPVVGVSSYTGLNALPNWLRQSAEGAEDDDSFATICLSFGEIGYLSPLITRYFPPTYPSSRPPFSHPPRAPPFV